MNSANESKTGWEQGVRHSAVARPRFAQTRDEPDDRRLVGRVEEALDDLRHDIHAYRIRQSVHFFVSPILWGGLLALVVLNPVNFFWAFTPIVVLQAMLTIATTYRFHSLRPLIEVAHPRAVNALALACWKGDRLTRRAAAEALKRTLPTLRANDAVHMTPEGMAALLGLLQFFDDEKLLIAILGALEQVGDAKAVPAVERLLVATAPRASFHCYDRQGRVIRKILGDQSSPLESIREAAWQCLPYLKTREEQDRARSRLLRPVTEPVNAGIDLLRPAKPESRAAPEALLRPAAPDDAKCGDP
jgi:hypothetical protein